MGFQLDPDVSRELAALPSRASGAEPPAVGDVATRRRNFRRMTEEVLVFPPPDADVAVRRYRLTCADGVTLPLSWYHGADAESRRPGGAVLYFHGGGMIFGLDVLGRLYDSAVRHYVAASGVPMLVVDYRVAPEHPQPVPVEDCYAALIWLCANAVELGVDPARIAVMGDSAGGGLAAAVCLLARDRGGPAIAAQLLLSPMLDDRTAHEPDLVPFLTWSYEDNATAWSALLGESAGGEEVSPYAAPARADDLRGLPPAYLDVGELDIFRDQTLAYGRRLAAAGVSTELHLYAGCPHEIEWLAPATAVARRMIAGRVRRMRSLLA